MPDLLDYRRQVALITDASQTALDPARCIASGNVHGLATASSDRLTVGEFSDAKPGRRCGDCQARRSVSAGDETGNPLPGSDLRFWRRRRNRFARHPALALLAFNVGAQNCVGALALFRVRIEPGDDFRIQK